MKISDSHTDFLTELKTKREREEYISSLKNVKTLICAVFTTNKKFSMQDIENFKLELEMLSRKYKINLLLSIEDLGFVKGIEELNQLVKLKPFSVTLTWNYENQFAGGAHSQKGLTTLGKYAVEFLERNNIRVDTAHMSRNSFKDFLNITSKPIFNSHSNINALKRHKRNLTIWQIESIAKSGGYLGLTIYDEFIKPNCEIKDVAKQIEWLLKHFKKLNFGFGTDLFGCDSSNLPKDLKKYSDFEKLKERLIKIGLASKTIEKVFNENLENFIIKFNEKSKDLREKTIFHTFSKL